MPKNSRKTKVLQHPTQVATKQNSVAVEEKKTVANSWLEVPDEATLPPQVQALFQEQRDRYGFVHSFFLGYSLNPEHLLLWFNYYNANGTKKSCKVCGIKIIAFNARERNHGIDSCDRRWII
jgi:hypothetical protein